MSTPRRNFFGTGSVIVPSDGEGAVRRSAITADKLVTQPFEGIDVIPDLVGYAARTHGRREAVGWRNIINIYEEEIEVKRTVGGKEVTETMRNRYFELSNFEYISFLEVRERVLELARGLLHYGILKTDVFNIYAQTRYVVVSARGARVWRAHLCLFVDSVNWQLIGSTGAPKGVVLTHANVVASIGGVFHMLGHHLRVDDAFLAYLPLAHILEYVVELALFTVGMKTGYGRVKTLTDASVRNCKGDILAFQPTILVGVPQVWEMIRKDILAEVNARRSLWKSISSSVRAATGGRLRLALSGGAALSKETQEFFSVAPVTMLQGYGMTESCAMCAILPPELMQYGVVGLPSPCIEIKLIDVPEAGYKATGNPCQGEVCIRGPSMIKGYYKRPDLNEDETIFTKDGWFRTGDVGQWNPDGTLSLIDRIENLVKLQGGEYIALERLEATYRSCNLVSNICVHASAEAKQPIAIIIPHEPNLRYVLAKQSLPDVDATASLLDLCHNEAVQELVLKECNLVGKKNDFKGMEMLEAVILTAEEWTPESGLVTAVQTVQRRKIAKHFQHLMGRFHPLQDVSDL
ncbi:acetyl-CoA synthetase-like protein [Imleria badia]|nr:acetyl-CoA synthetase-like protein [Imleria badia]